MTDQTECECPPCDPGLPAWLATFADLMSLLMCFFVLLLSFSEMDVLKFKQLAGSMREAFGVQNQIKVEDIPKGTSVIAQEFSPGRPEPTPLNEVRQMTINSDLNTLDVRSVVPNHKLVITDALQPGYRPAPEPFMTATILIEPAGKGSKYTAIACHNSEASRKKHEEMGFHEGWGTVADQLVAYMKSL
jgi:flagellar motor protein MotB